MSENTRIYHNPRCSKSRETLKLLEENGVQPDVIQYLDTPPSAEELKTLLRQLNLSARELLRTGEDAYKELDLKNPDLTEDQLIQAMVSHPKLIQRPIVVRNDQAVLGRPPEAVLKLLNA